MARIHDIEANLQVADDLLHQITLDYQTALNERQVDPVLYVKIKNLLENLRSPLDYLASEIAERQLSLGPSHRCYFPVACENAAAFSAHVRQNLPGLDTKHADVYAKLEAVQPYNSGGCAALAKLSKLVNENKHNRLSAQTRTEKRGLKLQFPGGSGIKMSPGSSISGTGVISSGGGSVLLTGDSISGDQPAKQTRGVDQTVEAWVSFSFSETGDDVLGLLRQCRRDVGEVVEAFMDIFS